MNDIRGRLSRLEEHADSVDGELGPLTSTSYMHGVHIRVLEQDRDMAEAALAANGAALEATQEEVERLRAREDRKQKGPAE